MGQVSFLQSKGIVIEDMYYLPYLAEKYGTKKLVDMIAKGGDVNGMTMRTENTKDWLFDSPFDTEQSYIFIFPSDKGDFAVSGNMNDCDGFIAGLWLENEYEQWREHELCRAS